MKSAEKLYNIYLKRFNQEHSHYDDLMNWDKYEALDEICYQLSKQI